MLGPDVLLVLVLDWGQSGWSSSTEAEEAQNASLWHLVKCAPAPGWVCSGRGHGNGLKVFRGILRTSSLSYGSAHVSS